MSDNELLNRIVLAIQNNPTAFVLLLGSGVSRSAKIMTGWEITEDLVRKLAEIENETIKNGDWEKWYFDNYNIAPNYCELLDKVASSSSMRRSILNNYFEPNRNEKEHGEKIPQESHKSIAKLVSKGFIRIIITTNFDRLLEQAIEDEGIIPCIITENRDCHLKPDEKCIIVKINGDYKDNNIKNTERELSEYNEDINNLLKKIFEDHGLIICGWSGEYDLALMESISKNLTKRYPLFWTKRKEIVQSAKELIKSKSGELIKIESSDKFFREVEARIDVLKDYNYFKPEDLDIFEKLLKKYISDENKQIEFEDKITETIRIYIRELPNQYRFNSQTNAINEINNIENEIKKILIIIKILARRDNENKYIKQIQQLKRRLVSYNLGSHPNENLLLYPNLLIHYVLGIISLKYDNQKYMRLVFRENFNINKDNPQFPLIKFFPNNIFLRSEFSESLAGNKHVYEYLYNNILSDLFIDEEEYKFYFHLFELLYCLLIKLEYKNGFGFNPIGLFKNDAFFGYYHKTGPDYSEVDSFIKQNLIDENSNHYLLNKVFNKYEQKNIVKVYNTYIQKLRSRGTL